MITKKLAVPLINDKILQQAEHCYIATSAITEDGFEFIRRRIPLKCKMDIVTGLDALTSPAVLRKIDRHYQGRITLNIYTRNALHANLYVIDLPFRKSVAFVGSGSLSMEGLKDHEELFWKTTDPREVESLMSWYTSYFQFGVPLNENLIREYELLYPEMRRREIRSAMEKRAMIALTAGSFQWDTIRFRNQYFNKEDYTVLSNENARSDHAVLRLQRTALGEKLMQLHERMAERLVAMGLILQGEERRGPLIANYPEGSINAMHLVYKKDSAEAVSVTAAILQKDFMVALVVSSEKAFRDQRLLLYDRLGDPQMRSVFFAGISALKEFTVHAGGVIRAVESFRDEKDFFGFMTSEDAGLVDFEIQKRFSPGDSMLSGDAVADTVVKEFSRLFRLL